MTSRIPLLVFTDLDGTLLDHQNYDWTPATTALTALKRANAGLILASSKTAPEIADLRAELNMQQWPAIVENGAGVLQEIEEESKNNHDYKKLRTLLDSIHTSLRQHFKGFGDMTSKEVADITGLSIESASLAKKRSYSEPGLWDGKQSDKNKFIAQLEEHGIKAQQGGRFLTLSFGANKAGQLQKLVKHFQPRKTIALGDAPNDIEMLEAADFGIVVANPYAAPLPPLSGENEGRIIRTQQPGPAGWNEAVLDVLANTQLNKGENP